jgi:hypothetical protein
MTLPNGIRIPGWAVGALSAAATLMLMGWAVGQKFANDARDRDIVNYRLCRIEKALGIDPWNSCEPPTYYRPSRNPNPPRGTLTDSALTSAAGLEPAR